MKTKIKVKKHEKRLRKIEKYFQKRACSWYKALYVASMRRNLKTMFHERKHFAETTKNSFP